MTKPQSKTKITAKTPSIFASERQREAAYEHSLDLAGPMNKGCRAPICKVDAEQGTRAFDASTLSTRAVVFGLAPTDGDLLPGAAREPVLMHYGCAARFRGKGRAEDISRWVRKRWRDPKAKKQHAKTMRTYWDAVRPLTTTGATAERKGLDLSKNGNGKRH